MHTARFFCMAHKLLISFDKLRSLTACSAEAGSCSLYFVIDGLEISVILRMSDYPLS
jgi:hypothetical protein